MALLASASGGPALAAPAEAAQTLPRVTTTVNRLQQRSADVSQQVTMLDAEQLAERQVRSVDDLVSQVPGASVVRLFEGVHDYNYRGLNTPLFEGSSPLTVLVDGVPLSNRYAIMLDPDDIERVEVLRGPGSTLYGHNSIGGVLNVQTRAFAAKPALRLGGGLGSHGERRLQLALQSGAQGPLRMKLHAQTLRYAGEIASAEGVNEDRKEQHYLNLGLQWQLDALTRLRLDAFAGQEDSGYGRIERVTLAGLNKAEVARQTGFDVRSDALARQQRAALRLDRQLPLGRLSAHASLRHAPMRALFECDYGAGAMSVYCTQNADQDGEDLGLQWAQEEGAQRWLLGLSWSRQRESNHDVGYYMGKPGASLPLGKAEGRREGRDQALFGQWLLRQGDWDWSLGLRGQRAEREVDIVNTVLADPASGSLAQLAYAGRQTFTAWLPRSGVNLRLGPTQNVYASYNQGYLPGGFNHFQMSNVLADASFGPQRNHVLEAGYKLQTGELALNATAYWMKIADIQSMVMLPGARFLAGNLSGAHSKGLELDGQWTPGPEGWQLDGRLAYTQARYDAGALYQGRDVGGLRIERTPDFSASLGLGYGLAAPTWAGGGRLSARLEANALGKRAVDPSNTAILSASHWFNARLALENRRWGLELGLRNLTDATVVAGAINLSNMPGIAPGTYGRQLMAGRELSLRLNFALEG
ncbi:outer membrane receptor protein involved in Fe transport [Paucibacter oligotrophus]|uniref:Outer membrane receptor protein involved in Fe transport n=1 Tax=Roseateles oligotrophus TaxID=1769250 RepID=A0A840LHQ4_9BURK|nr:outer membrane receptor protein involved in Fe transport [Roseateles oligotrophus]